MQIIPGRVKDREPVGVNFLTLPHMENLGARCRKRLRRGYNAENVSWKR